MLRFCANLHFLYREHEFLDRFAAAARDGFRAVEMTFPSDEPGARIRAAADAAGVSIVEFNAPAGPIVTGVQRGLAAVPGRSAEYLDQIRLGLSYAKAFDCRLLLSLAGVVAPDADRKPAAMAFVENLKRASDCCARDGVTLLIETNNLRDNPNYFLRTLDEVRETIERVGAPNLRTVFDFYHVQVNEGDVSRRFLDNLDLIAHVQFANAPDRLQPDHGELDFRHIFRLIEASGYDGWLGAEYFPGDAGTSGTLEWLHATEGATASS
jgi:hydroxypyruvate isomerase